MFFDMSKEISNNGSDNKVLHNETKWLLDNTALELSKLKPSTEKENELYTKGILDLLTHNFGIKNQDILDIKAKVWLRSLKNEKEIKELSNEGNKIIDSDFGKIMKIAFETLRLMWGTEFNDLWTNNISSDAELLKTAIQYNTIKNKWNITPENNNFAIWKQTLKNIFEDLNKYAPKKEADNWLVELTSWFSEENRKVINLLADKDFDINVHNGKITLRKNWITTEFSKSDKLSFKDIITLRIEPSDWSKAREVDLLNER